MLNCLWVWKKYTSTFKLHWKNYFLFAGVLFSFQLLSAQERTITGKVTSGDTALSNVTVQVKGKPSATQTDKNGNFSLSAAPGSTLVFSVIGYTNQELKITDQSTVNVRME